MARKVRRKKFIEQNVYDKTLERIEYCYKQFDTIVVSFSGGKDSTALLNCTIDVARKLGKLPVKAVFVDEEIINDETIDYVRRVSKTKDVDLYWYCVNVKHRNACSNKYPFWWSWDEDKKDVWVRPLPPEGITKIKGFDGKNAQGTKTGVTDACKYLFSNVSKYGKVCWLTGIRTQESLRRYRVIASKSHESYLTKTPDGKNKNHFKAHPIYDWSSKDVWTGVAYFGWDYNITYDIFNLTGMHGKLLRQRVCPPFGEEPLRGLWIYKECFPSFWAKMTRRVEGVGAAIRYSNTSLYGVKMNEPPNNLTWRQYMNLVIDNYMPKQYTYVVEQINSLVRVHHQKSTLSITEDTPDPISGCSWKFLAKIAIKGDFKGRTGAMMENQAEKTLKNLGITLDQAIDRWATDEKKQQFATLRKKQ